ncbi:helix-turn-helix domain-containing protein [Aeromicrobium choanae]|uniref:Transcriptional regulator, AraC family n=1 Tax=Aeromicrobium choanae TaxID=1736691 RepID=A0A1T4Z7F3_9ACTN|nr:helix-turn-helix domain-containing protein [Aeromicrobium choanae]SKB09866.1 transcriptional regulator, AraC family [Aeromicrobium choanae]
MPLILDTEALPEADRTEQFVEVMRTTSRSSVVEPDLGRGTPTSRMRFTPTGQGSLFTNRSSSTRISLSPREAADADDAFLAVAIQLEGTALRRTPTGERLERPGDVFIVDQRSGFDVRWPDISHTAAYLVPRELLGFSRAEEDLAAAGVQHSPLYPMLRRHMVELARLPDELLQGPVGTEVDGSTVALLRALIISTRGDHRFTQETSDSTLLSLVQAYIRQHARDADLDATRIAQAVNVSRRTIYRLFSAEPTSLEQYVISTRLEAARNELESGDPATPIASIAYRFAFKDPRHFVRRFKSEYGLTPHEFRAQFGASPPRR